MALLIVLLIVMVITITSLAFLSQSDIELACGRNMSLRTQMDILAESGLEHARVLILSPQDISSEYWTGDVAQQIAGGDNYYDVVVTRDDSDPTNRCNYIINCNAYRLKNGEKIGISNIKVQLRLDPVIAYWIGSSTTVSQRITINGDVYCAGNLSNSGKIAGDVFASGTITGANITGQKNELVTQRPVDRPKIKVKDFLSNYYIGSTAYSTHVIGSYVHPSGDFSPSASNPAGVRYRSGGVKLPGNVNINGTLAVDGGGGLRISGENNTIVAVKNFPALLINGDLKIETGGKLEINGLVIIRGKMQVSSEGADVRILGGLFVEDGIVETTEDSSGSGNDGVLYNSPTFRPEGGQINGAIEFDGIDDTVEELEADSYLNGLSAITFSLWVKSDVVYQDRGIMFSRDPTGADAELGIRYDRRGAYGGGVSVIKASIRGTSGYTQIESTSYTQTTNWQHLALVWESGSSLRLYINGVQNPLTYDMGTVSGTISGVQKLMLGKGTKSRQWDGMIDDVRIYNRALDPNDIYPPTDGLDGLIGHWRFDESGSNVTVTAAPNKTAIVLNFSGDIEERWVQAAGAFFRSIKRE